MILPAPRLSICIPTYNRGAFIGVTLASIATQITPDVEVVVSDNASSDDTPAVVERFRAVIPRLIYSRTEANLGFSRNFMRAVDLGSGDYCLLLGSDDVVCDGMMRRVLREIESCESAYIFDRLDWDAESDTRHLDPVLDDREERVAFRLGERADLLRYMRAGRTIASLFSFISSVVFKRAEWDAVELATSWYDCAFPQAMRLFGMFAGARTLKYVRAPLVLNRLGNDTFNPGGRETIRRLMMDFDGYRRIVDQYWHADREVAAEARAVMRRTHPAIDVFKFRRIVKADEVAPLCVSLAEFGYGRLFVWFYRTEWCRVLVLWLKRGHQFLGRPWRASGAIA